MMQVNMKDLLMKEAMTYGDKLEMVNIKRLSELQSELEDFKNLEDLNGFQRWIVTDLYRFELPETGFEVKSIIILATYHPFSADIELNYQGKTYYARCQVHSEDSRARQYLSQLINKHGYQLYETEALPIKRLAVQSGLAEYGRNNITYVEGMGSNVSYLVFYSDIPCEEDAWRAQCVAKLCSNCNACIELCPTGAIRHDRFLIDNQSCLSCINEVGGEFPDWLPKDIHHTLYDCLRCQEKCPLNEAVVKDTIGPICFSEEETGLLLEGKGMEAFSDEFNTRVDKIGLFRWQDGLARNIKAIMQVADAGNE